MSRIFQRAAGGLALLLGLSAGCGGESVPPHQGPGGASPSAYGTGARSLDAFCAGACPNTRDQVCFSRSECVSYCEGRAGAWTQAERDAFAACYAESIFCYWKIEDCMAQKLHPEGRR